MGGEGLEGRFGADEVEAFWRNVDHIAVDVDDGVDLTNGRRSLDAETSMGPFAVIGAIDGVCAVFIAAVGRVGTPPSVEVTGADIGLGAQVPVIEEVGV